MDLFIETLVSFTGGILTFASPCLLAVQLGYVVLITAIFLPGLNKAEKFKWHDIFTICLIFSAGFAIVFILSTYPGYTQRFMMFYHLLLSKIAGAVILYFAIAKAGKFQMQIKSKIFLNLFTVFLLGASLSIAWTHCLNSVLAMIITISGVPHTAYKGLFLLFVYSIGLGLPFILLGILVGKILYSAQWFKDNGSLISNIAIGALIIIGLSLVFTPLWIFVSSYLVGIAPKSIANGIMKEMVDIFIGDYSIIH